MKQYEIFDGRSYRFTVMPSENPRKVLEDERKRSRNPRLRMVEVEDGRRTEVEGPSVPEPLDDFDLPEGYEEEDDD